MLWRQNSFAFARRLPVRWSAQAWQASIAAAAPLLPAWPTDRRLTCSTRQVWIFRQSPQTPAPSMARNARSLTPTFLNLPRLRFNNPSASSL